MNEYNKVPSFLNDYSWHISHSWASLIDFFERQLESFCSDDPEEARRLEALKANADTPLGQLHIATGYRSNGTGMGIVYMNEKDSLDLTGLTVKETIDALSAYYMDKGEEMGDHVFFEGFYKSNNRMYIEWGS
jgi:hypothetical protein